MERKELEFVLENNHYLKGGTKEACVKAGDFIVNSMNPGNQLHAPLSCVKADEFVEAVKTLIAFAFRQEDAIPETMALLNPILPTKYSRAERKRLKRFEHELFEGII